MKGDAVTIEISEDAFRDLIDHKDEAHKLKAINAKLVEAIKDVLYEFDFGPGYWDEEKRAALKRGYAALKKARGSDG